MSAFVAGIGNTRVGELWGKSLMDLALEAAHAALKDAGRSPKDLSAICVGSMLSGELNGQSHLGAHLAAKLGTNVPAFRAEGACASGGLAFSQGVQALRAGAEGPVLVVGAEKMTDASVERVTGALAQAADYETEGSLGVTFPALYAVLAKAHMDAFGTTRKQMAAVAVKNHANAMKNPDAQYRREITEQDVLNAPPVADPLGLLDCSPISDGAAAVVLESKPRKRSVQVAGVGVGTDSVGLAERASLTELAATKTAAERAYAEAGIDANDVDFAEVHDCFTIAELLAIEDLGFVTKGQGGKATASGKTIPVNVSGGLKAYGHPVGATGVKQVCEIVRHLRGEAGERQVEGAATGLAHNVGGSGGTAVVTILKND